MSNRTVRINELLQREISHVLHTRYAAEAVLLTVTGVEIASDLRTAKVFFSLVRPEADPEASRAWLRGRIPAISEHLSKHVQLRNLPKLEFVHDTSPDRAARVLRILDELAKPKGP